MSSTGRDWGKVGALAGVVGVVVAILIAVAQYWLSSTGPASSEATPTATHAPLSQSPPQVAQSQPPQPIPLASQPAPPGQGEHVPSAPQAAPSQAPQPTLQAPQPASPDHGEHILGGVDVERYCQQNFDRHAVLREDDAYGWRCNSDPNFTSGVRPDDINVNMTDACRQEYGRTDAYDQYGSFQDPYSWKCYYRD